MTPPRWPYPRLFAHRGAGWLAPENTIAAMRVGHAAGYRAVEFDAKLSRDGVVMLLHDDSLERTTNGRGLARDHDMRALAALDAGTWHSANFAGESIPRFADVLHLLSTQGGCADVEIKPCPGREDETGRVVGEELAAFLKVHPAFAPHVLVSSFSASALAAARTVLPDVPRAYLVERVDAHTDRTLASLGCRIFATDHAALDEKMVAHMHGNGIAVMAYTVNEVARAQMLFGWSVDAIFTDNLSAMREAFSKDF
jgi:glycerophosphoryl diester phosphodiesterase